MIRRGFWLLAGAAGGIIGYRRVSSLTRQLSVTLGRSPQQHNAQKTAVRRHYAREAIRFTRDVREGMDVYSARHPRAARPTLGPGPRAGNSAGRTVSSGHDDHGDHDKREDH
jgi:hypothetical protein